MNHLTTAEVAQAIKRHIDDKEPFSLIRLGDGEAKLVGYPKAVVRAELDRSLAYWFDGKQPSIEQVMTLRVEMMAACRNADVLGLPNAKQRRNNAFHKLLMFLAASEGLVTGDVSHCGVHRALHEEGLYASFLTGLPRVTVIGCRDVAESIRATFDIGEVRWLPVPVEGQMGEPQARHYPERFSEALREIDAGPGDVYLVGAGPCGKCYCDAVKRDGGIGLDVGSMMDAWAGIGSRSYIKTDPERYRL